MSKENGKFEVGDLVFDLRFGNGKVHGFCASSVYPISCKFEACNHQQCESYTHKGFNSEYDVHPTLYHGRDLLLTVSEPIFEYQVLYKRNGHYLLSECFYTGLWQLENKSDTIHELVELFEPSKRLVKP